MKKISVLITKIALILFLISCSSPGNGFSKYQCPMKCEGEKTYEEPGKCPVCKMDLVKIKEAPFDSTMSTVKISGAMSNVMHKGELFGTIYLDTISDKTHLYGLGPEEYLSGELLIIDGKSYKSNVLTDTTMRVEETYNVKAPFFVYANVNKWQEQNLPDSVQTARQLETYIGEITKNSVPPFAFKLTGIVESATIHIVNLPKGSTINSQEDAHRGQITYYLQNLQSDIIGFFSTKHQGIFTHHDSYLHMHLITEDKTQMGHLDEVKFKKGTIKLFLPA